MAQFDNNNNGNRNNNANSISYYSGLRIRNYNDNNAINITFRSGLMVVGIAKRNDNNIYEDEISASLTPKKAAILVDQMTHFEAGEEGVFGTVLGMSDVQTAIGLQVKDDNKYLRIAKVDKVGKIVDQRTFAFPKSSDPSYSWSDFDNMKFTRSYNDNIDYQMFKNALIDFARNMSGAAAYGGLYMNRYQDGGAYNKLNAIAVKLGVSSGNNNGNRNYSNNGFFNNSNNSNNNRSANSQHRSYDEITSMIDDDDDLPFEGDE